MALSQPLDDHFHTNIADSTVRAAITRSRLDFIRLRKGHGLPDFGLLGALRMTTPANRLGAIRFSLLAPIPYKISHRWQQGTHTVRGHIWQLALASTCPRCSSFVVCDASGSETVFLTWSTLFTGTADHLQAVYLQIAVFPTAGFLLLVFFPLFLLHLGFVDARARNRDFVAYVIS